MRRVLVALGIALLIGVLYPARGIDKGAVVNSRHDFRVTSSATIKASTAVNAGEQLCVFCHTPHNSNPGTELWNQNMGLVTFGTYTSSTLQSTVGPLSAQDASKLCLSCHDGTIALGERAHRISPAWSARASATITRSPSRPTWRIRK
jgi:hypothetical protein